VQNLLGDTQGKMRVQRRLELQHLRRSRDDAIDASSIMRGAGACQTKRLPGNRSSVARVRRTIHELDS
jgi:hypothetical protein